VHSLKYVPVLLPDGQNIRAISGQREDPARNGFLSQRPTVYRLHAGAKARTGLAAERDKSARRWPGGSDVEIVDVRACCDAHWRSWKKDWAGDATIWGNGGGLTRLGWRTWPASAIDEIAAVAGQGII